MHIYIIVDAYIKILYQHTDITQHIAQCLASGTCSLKLKCCMDVYSVSTIFPAQQHFPLYLTYLMSLYRT